MRYNSTILIKGVQKPIITSKINAEAIRSVWEDKNEDRNYVFRVGSQSFSKSDIKFIDIIADSLGAEEKDRQMSDFYKEEAEMYTRESSWPADKKARHYDFFRMLFISSCGRFPTNEEQEKAYPIQFQFFTENPKRRLCDFNLLSPIIPRMGEKLGWFNLGGIVIAEKALFRDMQLAGQFRTHIPKALVPEKIDETIPEAKERIKENRKFDEDFNELVTKAVNDF